jgi:hypothetical protein
VNEEVFSVARALVEAGAKPDEIAYHFTQRRPLASLRILQRALVSLSLYDNAQVVTFYFSNRLIIYFFLRKEYDIKKYITPQLIDKSYKVSIDQVNKLITKLILKS